MVGTAYRSRFSSIVSRKAKAIAGLAVLFGLPLALLAYLTFSIGTELFQIGEMLPSLQLASLNLEPVTVDFTANRKLILLFFTTECLYCKQTLLNFDVLNRRYQSLGTIIGISLDGVEETRALVAGRRLSFSVMIDPRGSVREVWHIRQVPTLLYLDERLVLRKRTIGTRSISEDVQDFKEFFGQRALP